jgi:hypothetical protein
MQPTFTNFLNELTVLMLWAVASRRAAALAATKSFPKQESDDLPGSLQAIYPGASLSYPSDEADAAGIVGRSLAEISCEGPADVGD